MKTIPKPGAKLLHHGHPVTVVRTYSEPGYFTRARVWFAEVRYDDGFIPGPVGGRVDGTEDDPTWEARVNDGRVVRAGGSIDNPDDIIIEKGLRPRNDHPKEGTTMAGKPDPRPSSKSTTSKRSTRKPAEPATPAKDETAAEPEKAAEAADAKARQPRKTKPAPAPKIDADALVKALMDEVKKQMPEVKAKLVQQESDARRFHIAGWAGTLAYLRCGSKSIRVAAPFKNGETIPWGDRKAKVARKASVAVVMLSDPQKLDDALALVAAAGIKAGTRKNERDAKQADSKKAKRVARKAEKDANDQAETQAAAEALANAAAAGDVS